MRIRITKKHRKYAVGQTVDVSPNEAFGLLDGGFGVQTKDIVDVEMSRTSIPSRKSKGNVVKRKETDG